MAAKGKIQKCTITRFGGRAGIVRFDYPQIGKFVEVDTRKIPDDASFHDDAYFHGIKQGFGDVCSGDDTGEAKFEMATRWLEGAYQGIWGVTSQTRDTSPQVIEAAAELLKKSVDDIEEMLEDLSDDDRKAKIAKWRAQDSVKLRMMQIAERKLKERAKGSTFEV
jgi:hypothetical protein